MLSKECFVSRLETIKELDEKLANAIRVMTEQNPFVEDGYGVGQAWVYEMIVSHLYTLFLSVNEEASHKPLIEDVEPATKGYVEGKTWLDSRLQQDETKLKDLVEYFYWESGWGGKIEVEGKEYDLSKPEELYEYIKNL